MGSIERRSRGRAPPSNLFTGAVKKHRESPVALFTLRPASLCLRKPRRRSTTVAVEATRKDWRFWLSVPTPRTGHSCAV